LESEGYLRLKPDSVTFNKKLVMNLDGKVAAAVLGRMASVFGGDVGSVEDVHFEEAEAPAVLVEGPVSEEPGVPVRKKRLVDLIFEEMEDEEDRKEGVLVERGKAERDFSAEASGGTQGVADDLPGVGKGSGKKRSHKKKG
jgi:hypothetical protein